jgi:hypothetical protein
MKTYILTAFVILLLGINETATAQYVGCPHGSSPTSGQPGYLAWRFKDPSTGSVATNPQANTVYRLEIYTNGAPAGTSYSNIGFQGTADGFKVYSSLSDANNDTNNWSDASISSGVGPDVGADQTAVFYIRTLPSSDPDWSGQLTAFKVFGTCYPGSSIGYPNEYFKKTLTFKQ